MTTFKDIFKSNFLENVTAVTLPDMALALALSFCLGMFIYFVYRKTYSGVMFSRTFGGSLVAMTMITTMVACYAGLAFAPKMKVRGCMVKFGSSMIRL